MADNATDSEPSVRSILDEELIFASVAERDVDFLLVEEFRCSPSFQHWFLQRSFPDREESELEALTLTKVLHSLSSSVGGSGETDIMLVYERRDPPSRLAVLIEDKVAATLQDRQGERYQERKQALLAEHVCDAAACVFLAPQAYIEKVASSQPFDVYVPYEAIVEHWRGRLSSLPEEPASRLRHRCDVLLYAIHQYRRGWQLVPDDHITSFWAAHYERARVVAPDLRMKRPDPRPTQSRWVYFNESLPRDPRLPTRDLYHKMSDGQVHFVVHTWAEHLGLLEPVLRPKLDGDMYLTTAGRALVIALDVPQLDLARPADEQYDAIDAALQAASRLREWCVRHRSVLHDCARLIPKDSNEPG